MNRESTEKLADLLTELRPDWERWLVASVLSSHPSIPLADFTLAAVRWAIADRRNTPKGIKWSGPHWSGCSTGPDPAARDRGPRCTVCGKPEGRCLVERPGPDEHEFEPTRLAV